MDDLRNNRVAFEIAWHIITKPVLVNATTTSNPNVNSNVGNRRNAYLNQIDQPQTGTTTNKILPRTESGIPGWGLITTITNSNPASCEQMKPH